MPHQGVAGSQGRWRNAARWVLACACLCLAAPLLAENGHQMALAREQARASASAPQKTGDGSNPSSKGTGGLLEWHSDLRFELLAPNRKNSTAEGSAYEAQVRRVTARLQAAARTLYPDACQRIGAFDVYVADTQALSTMSSGGGKIAVSAGFASRKPTDPWLAFVIAREMGHVLAGHHDSNSGASLAVSVLMTVVLPGSGLLKSAISFGGSEIAAASRHDSQSQEADQAALRLLYTAGYSGKSVLQSLRQRPLGEEEAKNGWSNDFRASVARLTATLPGRTADSPGPRGPGLDPVPPARPAVLQPVAWRPGVGKRTRASTARAAPAAGGYATASYPPDFCAACSALP